MKAAVIYENGGPGVLGHGSVHLAHPRWAGCGACCVCPGCGELRFNVPRRAVGNDLVVTGEDRLGRQAADVARAGPGCVEAGCHLRVQRNDPWVSLRLR